MSSKNREIPSYPGPLPKKPPEPPKYLVAVSEDGSKHSLITVKGTPPEVRPQGVGDPNVPIVAKEATVLPQRDYTSPAHYYPPRKEYVPPGVKVKDSNRKDSRRDVKNSFKGQDGQIVTYSTPPTALPKLPAIPRPFVPPSARSFDNGPMLHARTADGKILGSHTRRMVPPDHVPHLATDGTGSTPSSRSPSRATQRGGVSARMDASGTIGSVSGLLSRQRSVSAEVGPTNPVVEIDDVWSACWDDEAGATYYYNRDSGEATWVMPGR
jgi:hypothetical protein